LARTFRQFMNDADKYVTSHIYALEAQTVNDLFAEYERAAANIFIQLEGTAARYGTGETWSISDAYSQQRTQLLVEQIMSEMKRLTQTTSDMALRSAIQSYYAGYYGKAWATDIGAQGNIDVPVLPIEAVRAAILKPYEGNTFVERFRGKDDDFQSRIRKSIVQSQINGETIYQAQKRISAELGIDISRRTKSDKQAHKGDFNRTQMIARTEIIRTSNLGSHAVYEANKDLLEGWTWIATNDDRTCPVCGDLDNKNFTFKSNRNPPPAHPSCRCSSLPYFKDGKYNDFIRANVPTFKEWAIMKGINQNIFGQAYDLRGQKPPKSPKGA
jgi:SPP1 gp7 family putative phage head morphogenesis protein